MAGLVEVNWNEIPPDSKPKIEVLANLVVSTICALVEQDEAVVVKVHANHRRVMFTVRVAEDDVGLALGRHGAHANALRTLLIAACKKLHFHMEMDIGGPTGDPDWSSS